jgi:hypothetical protein
MEREGNLERKSRSEKRAPGVQEPVDDDRRLPKVDRARLITAKMLEPLTVRYALWPDDVTFYSMQGELWPQILPRAVVGSKSISQGYVSKVQ